MFDVDLYRQVLGLSDPWKVVDVRLDMEATAIHVHVQHAEGCRWKFPKCDEQLSCYDHADERTWRHLNTCQFQTLGHAGIPQVKCPEHGVVQVTVPWAEPHGRFTILMERFVIEGLQACQTVKGACQLLGISWDQAWHVMERAVDTVRKREHRGLLQDGDDRLKRTKYLWLSSDSIAADYGSTHRAGSIGC